MGSVWIGSKHCFRRIPGHLHALFAYALLHYVVHLWRIRGWNLWWRVSSI